MTRKTQNFLKIIQKQQTKQENKMLININKKKKINEKKIQFKITSACVNNDGKQQRH